MAITARDLMTNDVETVAPDDEIGEVLTRLARVQFNGFPVTEDGEVVGIVTQHDLVHMFQPSDRTLWIPIGFPPFLESLEYGFDLSWDELDTSLDLAKNAGKPIRSVMTEDVVTVTPDDDIDHILDLLVDTERDINRLPVVEDGSLVGIIARQDVLRALRDERREE
ncbi:CBS domain containing membrane protein [Haladaptatus paucihalophilus DX253]|uniref:CBS domain containing membrane protein n=1 Tax=Haladaptatus paucihalophilus DX253 TaxID=797209 RepID=E7QNK4_HALPU|nr:MULTISPECIES: CBS domain-containing protein [Haladaptatus]EFW94074.1 CBS domain containing membrane protein [Haladaptatus paucihalophilus DX253]GKZ13072.1 histidine kinase [Haladaptatus sp. T7]SHK62560.1 CBS domain-containing protein [Haladaptatus paucihalophilus DX253]